MIEPFRLIQEEHLDDPWRVLLACILLNQTRVEQVRPVLDALLHEWPNAAAMADAPVDEVEEIIAPIGLKKRGGYITEMSAAYVAARPSGWEAVLELPGCGRYAAEAWRMLVEGDRTFIPKDMKLRARMIWWRMGECQAMISCNSQVGVKLPGTPNGPMLLVQIDCTMSPGYWRDILLIPKEERKHWKVLESCTPEQAAEKWLDSKSIALTSRAREAVMLLVLTGKNKFVGKFEDGQEEKIAGAAPEGAVTFANVEALRAVDIKNLLVAYNSIVAPDDKIKKFADDVTVDVAADMVWAAAETKVVKVKEEKPAREPGDKEKVRAILIGADAEGHTIDEMASALGCDKKRISDYICYLKNAKYCGEKGPLAIVKTQGRFFASPELATAYDAAHPVAAPVEAAEEQAAEESTNEQ